MILFSERLQTSVSNIKIHAQASKILHKAHTHELSKITLIRLFRILISSVICSINRRHSFMVDGNSWNGTGSILHLLRSTCIISAHVHYYILHYYYLLVFHAKLQTTYRTNAQFKLITHKFCSGHNQISLTSQIPRLSPTLCLIPDLCCIPLPFQVLRDYGTVVTLKWTTVCRKTSILKTCHTWRHSLRLIELMIRQRCHTNVLCASRNVFNKRLKKNFSDWKTVPRSQISSGKMPTAKHVCSALQWKFLCQWTWKICKLYANHELHLGTNLLLKQCRLVCVCKWLTFNGSCSIRLRFTWAFSWTNTTHADSAVARWHQPTTEAAVRECCTLSTSDQSPQVEAFNRANAQTLTINNVCSGLPLCVVNGLCLVPFSLLATL